MIPSGPATPFAALGALGFATSVQQGPPSVFQPTGAAYESAVYAQRRRLMPVGTPAVAFPDLLVVWSQSRHDAVNAQRRPLTPQVVVVGGVPYPQPWDLAQRLSAAYLREWPIPLLTQRIRLSQVGDPPLPTRPAPAGWNSSRPDLLWPYSGASDENRRPKAAVGDPPLPVHQPEEVDSDQLAAYLTLRWPVPEVHQRLWPKLQPVGPDPLPVQQPEETDRGHWAVYLLPRERFPDVVERAPIIPVGDAPVNGPFLDYEIGLDWLDRSVYNQRLPVTPQVVVVGGIASPMPWEVEEQHAPVYFPAPPPRPRQLPWLTPIGDPAIGFPLLGDWLPGTMDRPSAEIPSRVRRPLVAVGDPPVGIQQPVALGQVLRYPIPELSQRLPVIPPAVVVSDTFPLTPWQIEQEHLPSYLRDWPIPLLTQRLRLLGVGDDPVGPNIGIALAIADLNRSVYNQRLAITREVVVITDTFPLTPWELEQRASAAYLREWPIPLLTQRLRLLPLGGDPVAFPFLGDWLPGLMDPPSMRVQLIPLAPKLAIGGDALPVRQPVALAQRLRDPIPEVWQRMPRVAIGADPLGLRVPPGWPSVYFQLRYPLDILGQRVRFSVGGPTVLLLDTALVTVIAIPTGVLGQGGGRPWSFKQRTIVPAWRPM